METLSQKQIAIVEELQQEYHVYFTPSLIILDSKLQMDWEQAEAFAKEHYGFEYDDIDEAEGGI